MSQLTLKHEPSTVGVDRLKFHILKTSLTLMHLMLTLEDPEGDLFPQLEDVVITVWMLRLTESQRVRRTTNPRLKHINSLHQKTAKEESRLLSSCTRRHTRSPHWAGRMCSMYADTHSSQENTKEN